MAVIHRCVRCGKEFFTSMGTRYPYIGYCKRLDGKMGRGYFCSWTCKNSYLKEHEYIRKLDRELKDE